MSTIHIKGRLIAGVPAVAVRDALRAAHNVDVFTHQLFAAECKVSERKAREIVKTLLTGNFVEIAECPKGERRTRARWYRTTEEGFKLSNATGLQPIPRSKAERMLVDFLKRVDEVNARPEYIYSVSIVIVSGSYVRGESTLGDLDIFYGLEPRFRESDRKSVARKRVDAAAARGRRFDNIVSVLYWPEHEIVLYLKARTAGLNLHDLEEFFGMKKDNGFAYRVLIGDAETIASGLEAATPSADWPGNRFRQ